MECPECAATEWLIHPRMRTHRFVSFLGMVLAFRRGYLAVCGNCGREYRIRADGVRPPHKMQRQAAPPDNGQREAVEPRMRDADQRWRR
jgi:hypothetical protein